LLTLPNHVVTRLLHESPQTVVYRGFDRHDDARVILKTPADPSPDAPSLLRLRHEYAVLADIGCPGVPSVHGPFALISCLRTGSALASARSAFLTSSALI